jgi:hypothetical protein
MPGLHKSPLVVPLFNDSELNRIRRVHPYRGQPVQSAQPKPAKQTKKIIKPKKQQKTLNVQSSSSPLFYEDDLCASVSTFTPVTNICNKNPTKNYKKNGDVKIAEKITKIAKGKNLKSAKVSNFVGVSRDCFVGPNKVGLTSLGPVTGVQTLNGPLVGSEKAISHDKNFKNGANINGNRKRKVNANRVESMNHGPVIGDQVHSQPLNNHKKVTYSASENVGGCETKQGGLERYEVDETHNWGTY